MTDEDVIQRSLLIDGDGTCDDRRHNLLQKSFMKWPSSIASAAESPVMEDRMFSQLAESEYTFKNTRLIVKATSAQLQKYENIAKKIIIDIEKAKKDIEIVKDELEEAKIIHSNRVQHEVLANAIQEPEIQPARNLTRDELAHINEVLYALEVKRIKLNSKLDLGQKQCHIQMASIQQMRTLLESNESNIDCSILDDFDELDDDDEDLDILLRTGESDQMDTL